jgi:dephospho-CoA kinase
MARDSISREKAELRINAQKDDEFYIKASDAVLINDGSQNQFFERAETMIESILQSE